MTALLCLKNVTKRYRLGRGSLDALTDVSLDLHAGEILGVIGQSGSGKSTLARIALGLERPTAGEIAFRGQSLQTQTPEQRRQLRRQMQMIFQDPLGALNPRMTVLDLVAEGLDIHRLAFGSARRKRVGEILEMVGLGVDVLHRFSHEFSGGQRQRICIARALIVQPTILICDEPISALDLSIQAQVVNLLKELQTSLNLSYLFIAHDLAMVRYLSKRVAVMHAGRLVEVGETEAVFTEPHHLETQALIAASAHRMRLQR
jgi:oligopeptide transport system ATP-binding protein